MTDNESINALECCHGEYSPDCENCPNEKTCKEIDSVIALINRQKAEIERLKKENAKQKTIIEAIDNEMMPLPFETDFDKAIKTAKSEAIKDFAMRLKEKVSVISDRTNIDSIIVMYHIYNIVEDIVKEMTEGEENEM